MKRPACYPRPRSHLRAGKGEQTSASFFRTRLSMIGLAFAAGFIAGALALFGYGLVLLRREDSE